jgi:hypothetical protein
MKNVLFLAAMAAAAIFFAGCETIPPGAERGPNGTMAYDVSIEASPPGAKIEVNGEIIGDAPLHLKVFGDPDGTFHDFGSYYYMIRALPLATNQFVQTRTFMTGHLLTPQDHIPKNLYFDMNQPQPQYAPAPAVGYAYPPPAYYYGPPYPYYYGPTFRFYYGGGYYHGHGGHGWHH